MHTEKIANFLFEIASLRRLTRGDRQVIEDESSNVSDHSFRVAIIGMILAELEKCDTSKVLKMCLFHDVAESRTGDPNFINKLYGDLRQNEAKKDQMEGLPIKDEIMIFLGEYEQRKTPEASVARDADLLDQMILQQEYFYKDEKNLKIWQDYSQKFLATESAKKLAEKIRKSNPFEWLYQLAEQKAGEKIER